MYSICKIRKIITRKLIHNKYGNKILMILTCDIDKIRQDRRILTSPQTQGASVENISILERRAWKWLGGCVLVNKSAS